MLMQNFYCASASLSCSLSFKHYGLRKVEHHVVEQSGIQASVRLVQHCHQMLLLSSFWNTVVIKGFCTLTLDSRHCLQYTKFMF